MKAFFRTLAPLLLAGALSVGVAAQTNSAGRFDSDIEGKVTQQFSQKDAFHNVRASVEDGIVTLTGSVDLYQQKLDAAKKARKQAHVQGVRNLIAVQGKNVTDAELNAQLNRKLYYDRLGYDNMFNFVTASALNGAVTLSGETRTPYDRDSALSIASAMPCVKDVENDIKVSPASNFDDSIRLSATRAIYRDPVLSRYGIDPARPIRIVVDNGHLSLYGVVASKMDKQVAGIRASQVFGVFSVQNNLEVAGRS
jgi:hyperosmotically inducible protein